MACSMQPQCVLRPDFVFPPHNCQTKNEAMTTVTPLCLGNGGGCFAATGMGPLGVARYGPDLPVGVGGRMSSAC